MKGPDDDDNSDPKSRLRFRRRPLRRVLTLPPGAGPHPAVVLVHGFGATRDMMLPQYEQHFAAAGVATLAFDYRSTGASAGEPRQRISMRRQRVDVAAAMDFLSTRPEIDSRRIGLWGTSLGGMHVLRVAAARNDVAVAVVQCPIVDGIAAARSLGVRAALRLMPYAAEDLVRATLRRGRRYVPIVGPPGSTAAVAEAGWRSTLPADGCFDNRVAAGDVIGLVWTSASRRARDITAPLLVCVCDRENLIDPACVARVARLAPRGEVRHYDSDHFEIYHPPLVARVLADQTAFLREHLDVRP
ncbi:alpha/beta hydrolase [Mycolicibacterium agri]|nr:alpha/beta hydrolase [Mycolicibacterium agri]